MHTYELDKSKKYYMGLELEQIANAVFYGYPNLKDEKEECIKQLNLALFKEHSFLHLGFFGCYCHRNRDLRKEDYRCDVCIALDRRMYLFRYAWVKFFELLDACHIEHNFDAYKLGYDFRYIVFMKCSDGKSVYDMICRSAGPFSKTKDFYILMSLKESFSVWLNEKFCKEYEKDGPRVQFFQEGDDYVNVGRITQLEQDHWHGVDSVKAHHEFGDFYYRDDERMMRIGKTAKVNG